MDKKEAREYLGTISNPHYNQSKAPSPSPPKQQWWRMPSSKQPEQISGRDSPPPSDAVLSVGESGFSSAFQQEQQQNKTKINLSFDFSE